MGNKRRSIVYQNWSLGKKEEIYKKKEKYIWFRLRN